MHPQLSHSFDSLQPPNVFQVTHLQQPTTNTNSFLQTQAHQIQLIQ